jgi:hypothetical protein
MCVVDFRGLFVNMLLGVHYMVSSCWLRSHSDCEHNNGMVVWYGGTIPPYGGMVGWYGTTIM